MRIKPEVVKHHIRLFYINSSLVPNPVPFETFHVQTKPIWSPRRMKLRFSYGVPITPAITSRQRQPNVRERSGDDKHIHHANNRIVKFKASAAAALDANLDLGAAAVAPRDIIGYWIVDNARLRRVHDLGIREHCSTYPLHQEPSVQFNFRPSPRRRDAVFGGHFDTAPFRSQLLKFVLHRSLVYKYVLLQMLLIFLVSNFILTVLFLT